MICPDFAIFCVPAGDPVAVEAVLNIAAEEDKFAEEEALN
jgi:hypothetical protein